MLVAPTTKGNAPTLLDVGIGANNIPQLNASGKLDSTVLPVVAVTERVPTSTMATRNALTSTQIQNGDIAIVSNTESVIADRGAWMLINDAAINNNDSWIKLVLPSGTIDVGQLPTSSSISNSTTTVPTTAAVNAALTSRLSSVALALNSGLGGDGTSSNGLKIINQRDNSTLQFWSGTSAQLPVTRTAGTLYFEV